MATRFRSARRPLRWPIAAAGLALTPALAQTPATAQTQLAPVIVSGRAAPGAGVTGWGDLPLARTPIQAGVFGAEQLKDQGAQRLSDLTRVDAAVSDAYDTEGYWDYLTVRGFVIDNRFNYRRDGLPISAETSIPLDNKARVEILKGTSGMQAGTSAPGGLVNFVVKRPLDAPLSSASIEWRERASVTASVDLSRRFGDANAFGVRLNAAAARLDPKVRDAKGHRNLLALAGDWRVGSDTLLEAEVETSHRSQPSVPGFSLLGNTVPPPVDPRVNLNNQPWSLPVVLDGTTGSLRWTQRLSTQWRFTVHAATQRLRSDDRVAFPFGVFDPSTYECPLYCDRFAPDGTYTIWEFRSDGERRRTDALAASLEGRLEAAGLRHDLSLGVLRSKVRYRFGVQIFDIAGTGNIDGTLVTPPSPQGVDQNTNRDERSTELSLRDAIGLSERLTAWLGLRHTRLDRQSVRTDGSSPTDYAQSFTTPFAALSYDLGEERMVYASWGRGIESEVTPNRSRYTNAGESLPVLKSRQVEVGFKAAGERTEWGVAAFDIVRPLFDDVGPCDVDASCTHVVDGTQHHRGLEASATWRPGAWMLRGSTQWLHARREGSQTEALNGLVPTNVPARTVKLQASYAVGAAPGLSLAANLMHESSREILPDNSASIPGYTRVDLGARYEMRLGATAVTWRAGIDNAFDKRAWRESPYQFGHAYLFPLEPRTLRLSVQAEL